MTGASNKPGKKVGGKPLSISGVYRVLTNSFYAGITTWEGQPHQGKHAPLLIIAEFEIIQRVLGRTNQARPKRHTWAYTGLLRCSCGLGITASHSRNCFGARYAYYYCTRRRRTTVCRSPWMRVPSLERQVLAFIEDLTVEPALHALLLRQTDRSAEEAEAAASASRKALLAAKQQNELARKNLRHLRTREQITDSEFTGDLADLTTEGLRLDQELGKADLEGMFEPE